MILYNEKKELIFWFMISVLVVLRMVMVSDVNLAIYYTPHDGSLYLTRAFHLLTDGTFGPYNSTTLLKAPGISLWIAFMRWFGVPYMLSINLIHIISSLYLIGALRRTGIDPLALLVTFALLLFNSVVFGSEWFALGREPLDLSLSILLVASMLFIMTNTPTRRALWIHGLIVVSSFTLLLFLREENVLLWSFLFVAVMLGIWQAVLDAEQISWKHPMLVVGLVTAMTSGICHYGLTRMIDRTYGLPIINDFSEGEFPKFIAAMRSASGRQVNPYISITQEALGDVAQVVPMVAPLFAQMPSPPTIGSYYHKRWGVSDEWPNSHIFLWIKDASIGGAGITPTLPTAQAYFKNARQNIEQACQDGRLKCVPSGSGMFPPLRYEWIPQLGSEMLSILKLIRNPPNSVIQESYILPVQQNDSLSGEDAITLGRQYQVAALNSFDSLYQWKITPPKSDTSLQATKDQVYSDLMDNKSLYRSPLLKWRQSVINFNWTSMIFVLLGLGATIALVLFTKLRDFNPVLLVALSFLSMVCVKIFVLGYVSVYMGAPDHRLFYSTHIILMALAPSLLYISMKKLFKI